jgi:CheY-like chemotaxis protein
MDIQDTSTWRILIVDDEPDNLEVVAESLQFFGASVKIARNGAEGLKVLEEFPATFILLDLSMPVMDGWEMRSRVKSNPKTDTIPVIALSAHAMAGDKERAMDAGFDGYLTKPVNVPTLLSDLREIFQSVGTKAEEAAPSAVTEESAPSAVQTADDEDATVPVREGFIVEETTAQKDQSAADVNVNAKAGGPS